MSKLIIFAAIILALSTKIKAFEDKEAKQYMEDNQMACDILSHIETKWFNNFQYYGVTCINPRETIIYNVVFNQNVVSNVIEGSQ